MIKLSMDKIDKEEFKKYEFVKSIKRMAKIGKEYLRNVKELVSQKPSEFAVFYITLTFKDNNEFELAKSKTMNSPVRRYLWLLRQNLMRHGHRVYTYFWVLEIQSRGVPHYHIFLVTDASAYVPYPDQSYWPWGLSQLQRVSWQKISKSYLSNYLEKEAQKMSIFNNLLFYRMKKFTLYICKEWRDRFFFAIISGYSRIRRMIAERVEGFIRKHKGWWDAGLFKYKIHMEYVFYGKYVYKYDNGVTVDVNGFILRYKNFKEFLNGLDYIFIFV